MLRTLRRIAERPTTDHEGVFLERYQRLYDRARRLTQDLEQAADLVQDAFVQWTLSRTPLDAIQNVDAYLFTMLAHLHVSQVRRAVRARQVRLDLLDHDCLDFALRDVAPLRQLEALDELYEISAFACNRRLTSRTGSVLLLRFFHGYYTREIARILRVPPANVDGFLHLARREARASLAESRTTVGPRRPASPGLGAPSWPGRDGCLRDLRASVFAFAHQRCYAPEWLDALYNAPPDDLPSCQTLAEIVTCPGCLDAVSRLLGLPPLAERHPVDSLGPGGRSGPGDGGTGGSGITGVAPRLRRHATDVFEHRPSELSILVNGFFVASHHVAGPRSEQTIRLSLGEAVRFVEVFSEQEVRLAIAALEAPPEGPLEQASTVGFSDDRQLDVAVDFSEPQPVLHVRYLNPSYRSTVEITGTIEPAEPSERSAEEEARAPSLVQWLPGTRWWTRLTGWGLRPLVASSAIALVLLLWGWWSLVSPSRLSAAEILARADAVDRAAWQQDADIEHRVFTLEDRSADGSGDVSRTRIEIWRRGTDLAVARRAYDAESGALEGTEIGVAGEADTVSGSGQQLPSTEAREDVQALVDAGEFWRLEPSAAHFAALSRGLSAPVVDRTDTAYVLRAEAPSSSSPRRGLVRIVLTLARDTLRPLAQTLVVHGPRGTREYHYVPRGVERLPAAGSEKYFVPEPAPVTRPGGVSSVRPGPTASSALSALDAAAIQTDALYLLDAAGALLGDQVSIASGGSGIRIGGIVDTPARKRALIAALAPVANHPFVSIHIETASDAARRKPLRGVSRPARGVEATADQPGGYDQVRRYLLARPADAWPLEAAERDARIEQEVLQFGADVLARARQSLQHAWALHRIVEQVPPDVAAQLPRPSQEKWRTLIREHAAATDRDLAWVRQTLQPVFAPQAHASSPTAGGTAAPPALAGSIDMLLALTKAIEEAVRSSFTLATTGAGTANTVAGPAFWDSLRRAERLAGHLAHVE